ncbi:MAG TPA: hypothetical protein VM489_16685, partial [Burkholderiales bacterium]|nr:hypothetical protein [Burkholderiales bacterium]
MIELGIDYPRVRALEQAYLQAPEVVADELLAAVTDADLLTYRELSDRMPVGAGGAAGLKGSLFHQEEIDGAVATGLVATPRAYAVPVELGTRPHFPPIEPLIDWVRAKLGIGEEKAARGVAFAIAHKIAVSGTRPQFP